MSILRPVSHCPDYHSFTVIPLISSVSALTSFFFKAALEIKYFLFHTHFRIGLSISTKTKCSAIVFDVESIYKLIWEDLAFQ